MIKCKSQKNENDNSNDNNNKWGWWWSPGIKGNELIDKLDKNGSKLQYSDMSCVL